MVNIEMANGKNIKIELYPDVAPITVANFEKLVKEGFYDGLIFHRVISGFMIQGGDPMGTGMGGAKEKIKASSLPMVFVTTSSIQEALSQWHVQQCQIQQAHSFSSCTRTLLILTDSMQHSAR